MKFRRLLKLIFQTDFSIAWITPEGKYIPYDGGNHKVSYWNFKKKNQEKLNLSNKNLIRVFNLMGQFGFSWNKDHKITDSQKTHINDIAIDFFKDIPKGNCYLETMDDDDNVVFTKQFYNIEDLTDFINNL